MKRIGFVLNFTNQGWLGGVSYFRNLFSALHDLPEREIDPVVMASRNADPSVLRQFAPAQVMVTSFADAQSFAWKIRRASQRYLERDSLFERFLRKQAIECLSHSGPLGRRGTVATLPWIPDFQELHLPEFFSPAERAARSRNVIECCRSGSAILVSSRSAMKDLAAVSSGCSARAEILSFVATVPPESSSTPRDALERKFGFQGRYFHLPNQFWKHKNHEVVVRALALIRAQRSDLLVLATGNTEDHRQPGHFHRVMEHARSAGVTSMFRPLGAVSHPDLMGLMRNSVAILNPSRFEGWSTSVEEAKSMGKQVVLSDIPVHREQQPPHAMYFPPGDADALAETLQLAVDQWSPAQDRNRMDEAQLQQPHRRKLFAMRYQEIVLKVLAR